MPDNTPKKKSTAKTESKPLRIADYNEYLSRKGAFDDSTSTYNDSIRNRAKLLGMGMKEISTSIPTKEEAAEMLEEGGVANVVKNNGKKETVYQKTSGKIAPVKNSTLRTSSGSEITIPIYKEPSQRVVYDETLKRTAPEKAKVSASQRLPGYKRVASSDPKYKNQREYSTYVKKEGEAKEDPFKKATLEARKRILQKNSKPKK